MTDLSSLLMVFSERERNIHVREKGQSWTMLHLSPLARAWLKIFSRFYLFIERGEGREREEEKHQCVVASHVPPTGDLACNPGMCPDLESNP